MKNKKELKIGDYILLSNLGEKVIYKIMNIGELSDLTIKIIYPRNLAKQLKEHNVFNIIIPYNNNIKVLGSDRSMLALYG